MKAEEQHLDIFTAPHGLGFSPNGDLHVKDWNVSGRITTFWKK